MKKLLLILTLFFLVHGALLAQCLNTPDFPFNTDEGEGRSWSSSLYSPAQLGGAQTISQLSVELNNVFAGSFTYDGISIYVREVDNTEFSDGNYPGTAGFTQVFSGSKAFNGKGTYSFTFNAPFAYSGTKYLEVFFIHNPVNEYPDNEPWFVRTQGSPIYIGKYGLGTSNGSRARFQLVINNINCDFTALPVRLISFNAAKEGTSTSLKWATSSEENASYFDIEHSRNGNTWTTLGSVKTKGSESATTTYSFPVTSTAGRHYFRLKIVDIDHTFSYSRIVQVDGEQIAKSYVYPNPVIDRIRLSEIELKGIHRITVQDVLGNVLFHSEKVDENGIDANQFPSGMLIVKVLKADGATSTYKIVKI
ncbi:T9SS type A sorting domain-containing protein [Dyadobacter sp. CY312]|uniref:T9SS type A sorting domain-containing protein n=1 Tax=Dyadobacter sp. CY312 TaxID=2907303 RepID=UPI001F44DEB3|nr:T9SS type A sorting domain-containing protein [Dyadobacter sp. CY312]MCE7043193.1 T9SS type A sorting domain-containing protein [Dyadobacter sp. CY312]